MSGVPSLAPLETEPTVGKEKGFYQEGIGEDAVYQAVESAEDPVVGSEAGTEVEA